jgi:hypothetical protein
MEGFKGRQIAALLLLLTQFGCRVSMHIGTSVQLQLQATDSVTCGTHRPQSDCILDAHWTQH